MPVNVQNDQFSGLFHIRHCQPYASRCEQYLLLRLESIGAQENGSGTERCFHGVFNIFQIRYVVSREICNENAMAKLDVLSSALEFNATLTIHRGV